MKTLFIFRRDLRTYDNTTLNQIISKNPKMEIIPIFIFNKKQIEEKENRYYSKNAVQFLFESLDELDFLNFFYTSTNDIDVISKLYDKYKFETIAFNKDYTPFAIKRDAEIGKWASGKNISVISYEDYTIHNMGEIVKDDNKPYLKFTPYYRKSILKKPRPLFSETKFNFITDKSKSINNYNHLRPAENKMISVNGGRKKALEILGKLKKGQFNNYDKDRDYPYLDKTTKMSAYIKFGCLSIREIYYSLPLTHGIVRELFWHDFYAIITFYFPYVFNNSFIKKYDAVKWNNNEEFFNKWKQGKTGFPIVDAAMRQLNTIGWMHNRCRMIVASFLVKNLLIDWRKGEEYFARSLVDYDPSSNNGGWQWCASTGTDSQPYFRIFSPTLQMKKYDPECIYIKKWVKELKDVPNKVILNWETKQNQIINYPIPIINTKTTAAVFVKTFKGI
jgi:deoxyribodipyrimidine photo-lyase